MVCATAEHCKLGVLDVSVFASTQKYLTEIVMRLRNYPPWRPSHIIFFVGSFATVAAAVMNKL